MSLTWLFLHELIKNVHKSHGGYQWIVPKVHSSFLKKYTF